MFQYADEFIEVCQDLGYEYKLYKEAEGNNLYQIIEKMYAQKQGVTPLWQRLYKFSSIYNPEAWRWIEQFVGNRPIVIFFDITECKQILQLVNGINITSVLANSSGFTFYVTDITYSYLICFNDHNFLIGCGTAKLWIDSFLYPEAI